MLCKQIFISFVGVVSLHINAIMKKSKTNVYYVLVLLFLLVSCAQESKQSVPVEKKLSKEVLLDKIKGGWAGQTIGCTYGGPTEFKYNGVYIPDYVDILWPDGAIKGYFDTFPGLYDDVYMDLTFVQVFDRLGLDAPVDSFAMAFANADYMLWAANQTARYNILHGIMPPASGHWLNNPHADDIDFQIEADFSGLMSPGMPNTAAGICDKIGHIMNYGNGWYGGVFVGAMYALAFVSDDIEFVVNEAIKIIPKESTFYQCITDVIRWHKQYPDDWKQTWSQCKIKWDNDKGSPTGVFNYYNIDAIINNAYIVIGLLYGGGDYAKTLEISTRCGFDSDCNPASAGGILGTMLGYSNIPEYWKKNLYEVEDIPFAYTDISLNKVYQLSYNQALQVIEKNGGKIENDDVVIRCQTPQPVAFEECFTNHYPIEKRTINKSLREWNEFEFDGVGFAIPGGVTSNDPAYIAMVETYVDGELLETIPLPADQIRRREDLFYKYQLPKGKHKVSFKWLNPQPEANVTVYNVVVYSDKPKEPFKYQ